MSVVVIVLLVVAGVLWTLRRPGAAGGATLLAVVSVIAGNVGLVPVLVGGALAGVASMVVHPYAMRRT